MIIVQQISGKERTRGPNLAVFIKQIEGVPMEEALMKADKASAVIASNKRLSQAFGSREYEGINDAFCCWSGTMTAYDKPDQKVGKNIEYLDSDTGIWYVFPVPEEHIGKKNILLVAEHPDFTLETDGNTRIVQVTDVGIVERFPTDREGWHLGDAKYDIPTGKIVDKGDDDARYLIRKEKRVGLVSRSTIEHVDDNDGWYINSIIGRDINLGYPPSVRLLGVAIEAALVSELQTKAVDSHRN